MGRLKKNESEVKVTLGMSVLPIIEDEIVTMANIHDRTKSWVAEKMLLRGLVAYRKDGKFTDEELPKRTTLTTSDKPLSLSRKSIQTALDSARTYSGEPLSQADRDSIEQALLEESGNSSTRRKRAKKS